MQHQVFLKFAHQRPYRAFGEVDIPPPPREPFGQVRRNQPHQRLEVLVPRPRVPRRLPLHGRYRQPHHRRVKQARLIAHAEQIDGVQRGDDMHAGAAQPLKPLPARPVPHQVCQRARAESERNVDAAVVVDVHIDLAPVVSRALSYHGEHLRRVRVVDVERPAEPMGGGDLHADQILDVGVLAIQGVDVFRGGRRTPARRPEVGERCPIHVAPRTMERRAERHHPRTDAPGSQVRPDLAQRLRRDGGVEHGCDTVGHMRPQVPMHESAAVLGIVLPVHGPGHRLEVHVAVDESRQYRHASRVENPRIRRHGIAQRYDDAVPDTDRRGSWWRPGAVNESGVDDRERVAGH